MARPSDLTPEQRAEIVLSLLRKEEPASVLARRHGISANTLGQWREDVYAKGVQVTIPKWQHWAKAAKEKLDQMMAKDALGEAA